MPRLFSRLAAAWRSLYIFDRPSCQVRLSIRQRLPFAILPLLLLWYLASPAPVAVMGAAALVGWILCSYLWARSMARRVSGQRRLRYAAFQVGDELEEQVSLTNDSILPAIWAEFYDTANLPGYTVTSVHYADSHSTVSWRDHTTCTRRGLFRLGPWELRLGDPFGLFHVRQVYLEKNEILVYPPLAPLPERLLPRGQVQGEERPLNQPLRAETLDAFTARPYQPGDPLRHIHWPVTARHDYPHVRVFEPEASSTVWLLADLDAAVHIGQGSDSSLENMIILLASLAAELLRRRVAVGLLAYSGQKTALESSPTLRETPLKGEGEGQGRLVGPPLRTEINAGDAPLVVTPQRGPLHLWDLLRVLATLEPAPGRTFGQLLARAQMLVGGRDQVLAVTPSLDPSWLGELYHFNRGRHGQGAGVILLDPASFGSSAWPAGAADTFASVLTGQGMRTSVVRQGELHPVSGSYGELSRWEFKILGTGRVFVRHAPKGVSGWGNSGDSAAEKLSQNTSGGGAP